MRLSAYCFGLALALVMPHGAQSQGAGVEWPTYGGDHGASRFSKLDQITTTNVSRLAPAWVFQAGNDPQGLQSTPIVVDGVMYVSTNQSAIYALDPSSGKVIWEYRYNVTDPRIEDNRMVARSRGVAVGHGLVFVGTFDNRVVAVDQETGEEVWRVRVQDPVQCGCNINAAPLVVKDLVVVGGTGGDNAQRGSISAFDAKTGRLSWRFYVIPAPGEPGNETWPEGDAWKYGGGAPWMTGSYDPELDLIYWGTGNAAPDLDSAARPGDNLYTASVVALDADTGKLRWHYQEVPHDVWDYDSAFECILADLPVRGRTRKLLIHPTKTGYVWVLDRTNGEFIGAWPMVEDINWVAGITEDGKLVGRNEPVIDEATNICPSVFGAKNWNQATFSPQSRLLYVPVMRICNDMYVRRQEPKPGRQYISGFWKLKLAPGRKSPSGIAAFDPISGEKKWEYPYRYLIQSSVLSTAGGLVFAGTDDGEFFALDANSGEKLWSFQTGGGHRGSSIAYRIDDRQYVATPSGSPNGGPRRLFPELGKTPSHGATLFVFALPEGDQ